MGKTNRVTIDCDLANDIYSLLADVRDESWHQAKYARERIEAALASDEPDAEELYRWALHNGFIASEPGDKTGEVMLLKFDLGSAHVISTTFYADEETALRAAYAADKEKK